MQSAIFSFHLSVEIQLQNKAKVMEDNGAPVDVVAHVRERAGEIISAHMPNDPVG